MVGTYADALRKKSEAKLRKVKRTIKRRQLLKAKPIKAMRKTLEAELENLWSLIIKLRDRRLHGPLCRICKVEAGNTGYHIVPKQRGRAIRWDLENGALSCSGCNYGELMNRSLYQDVKHVHIFGIELIERLKAKARTTVKYSLGDLIELRRKFKKMIEEGF